MVQRITNRYDLNRRRQRRPARLRDHDYRRGATYFVTVCTYGRECLFGEIEDGVMRLNVCGEAALDSWQTVPQHRAGVSLDASVVMPNHLHGIVVMPGQDHVDESEDRFGMEPTTRQGGARHGSLGVIVGSFKAAATKQINAIRETAGAPVWQRGYYEHIIADAKEMERIRAYILANPANWTEDENYPVVAGQPIGYIGRSGP